MFCRRLAVACVVVAGCAAGSATSGSKSVAPADSEAHPAAWYTIAAGRADFQKNAHDFDLAATDCTLACKALASLERAADHLCAVAEPDECTDARARVDRAKRAVQSQCGGC
jgi:hypothetical protein